MVCQAGGRMRIDKDDIMNILAIGAHPDDIEFGCGGALAKFTAKGHRVSLMVMSKGEMGGDPSVREREQDDSRAILGADRVYWGGYKDTHIMMNQEMIGKIEGVINKIKPTFIFCNFADDTHQDHRHLAQATLSATRYVRNVLFYEVPTTQNFNPQIFVDISATLNRKIEALEAHGSQIMKTNIDSLSIVELARSTANFRGIQGRVSCAEAFHSVRLFINV